MKKTYAKPEIVFESFLASANIAAGCEVTTGTPSLNTCAFTYHDEFAGDLILFTDRVGVCVDKEPEGYNGLCYHTFEGNSIFTS